MHNTVRKILEIYLREKRIIAQSEFTTAEIPYTRVKNALFVTLYSHGRVIASQGRIQCKKENTLFECLDLTLLCLKDSRFSAELQTLEALSGIQIRVDMIESNSRRILANISDLNVRSEGIIFLSQNLGVLSVILPNMIRLDPTPEKYFALAQQKAGITTPLSHSDYVIYGLSTKQMSDF